MSAAPTASQPTNTNAPSSAAPKHSIESPRPAASAARLDPASDLRELQRGAGNRATARAIAELTRSHGALPIGRAADRYEREAERVSRQVMGMPSGATDAHHATSAAHTTSGAHTTTAVQAPARTASRRGGAPLGKELRGWMEPRFAADFSAVRVHLDGAADALNRSLGSRAFTAAHDIYFRRGEYQPQLNEGRRLLAHELTHVVQQSSGGGSARISRAPLAIQRMILRFAGSGLYDNIDPQRVAKGEQAQYNLANPADKRAVERHWADEMRREEEEQQARRRREAEEDAPPRQMQAQALLPAPQQEQAHAVEHGQLHIPDVTVSFTGQEYLDDRADRVIASSRNVDLHAMWTPGPVPPDGHSPDALIGWIQNITYKNEQADYFDDDDNYVESSFNEYIGQMIDSDDAHSAWYNPPRPYNEVRSGAMAALVGGGQLEGARGIPLFDKPQDMYPKVSPRGGKLYRFGGITEFTSYLVMTEPDGSRPTVLEHVTWKYEYAYTLRTTPPAQRGPSYARPTQLVKLYADTYVTGRGEGQGARAPNMTVVEDQPHGNVFFNDHHRATWEKLYAARDPYDGDRFPSLI